MLDDIVNKNTGSRCIGADNPLMAIGNYCIVYQAQGTSVLMEAVLFPKPVLEE